MLTPEEQLAVQGALTTVLAADGNVRQFITATFGNRSGAMLRELPASLVMPDRQAAFVLMQCLDARWPAPQQPPLASLLEVLLTTLITGGEASLVALRDRVQHGVDPNPDPVMTFWVNETLPFFSRQQLRPVVKSLLGRDAQPILKIVGPRSAGKSYSRWLIDHVCALRIDHHVVVADLAEGIGPSFPVEELADTLVTPIADHPPRPPRAASNYAASLGRWILNAAINVPGRWIFVLDGFNQPDLQEETRELVRNLAQVIAGPGDFRKRMRLVLIDYEATLPNVHIGTILFEQVPAPTALTADDLAACLRAHYDDLNARGRPRGTLQPTALTQTANVLLADASAAGSPDLKKLNDELTLLRLNDLRP